MSAQGTLFAPKDSYRTYRILIAGNYGGSKVTLAPNFKLGETNNESSFLSKFPFGKVPAFETTSGDKIVETSAISHFVGNSVSGKDAVSRAHVLEWVSLADNEFLPAVLAWVLPSVSCMQHNKQNVDSAKAELLHLLERLNDYLLPKTFLVGERISLADITLACNLLPAYQHVLEPEIRGQFINVTRWFETCVNQPHFQAVLGSVQLCDKAAQFDVKKFKETQEACGASVSDAGGKKEKKAGGGDGGSGKKEKKEKPKKEAEPEEEPDAAELALAEEPKKKDPFEQFDKGTFVLDEFKRVYSNEDTVTKAIPYFFDNFDADHYSVWYCEYKYADELKMTFMSCNLITGMMQRLDRMRKHSFGSVILFGENNNSSISGVWFWRGPGLAFELSPDCQIDYESYTWKQLDVKNAGDKKMISEYLAWEGDFDGKKFNQGKIFK